jgi:ribonuclease D
MIPNYRSASGKALGYKVAAWAKANARDLEINYVIWNQHIWNVQRNGEGWRYMADRGDDSSNHKNHVHITVLVDGLDPR